LVFATALTQEILHTSLQESITHQSFQQFSFSEALSH